MDLRLHANKISGLKSVVRGKIGKLAEKLIKWLSFGCISIQMILQRPEKNRWAEKSDETLDQSEHQLGCKVSVRVSSG